jgi:hypothetical protein
VAAARRKIIRSEVAVLSWFRILFSMSTLALLQEYTSV